MGISLEGKLPETSLKNSFKVGNGDSMVKQKNMPNV